MENIIFEWDENKNTINKRKHKISFEDAKIVLIFRMINHER